MSRRERGGGSVRGRGQGREQDCYKGRRGPTHWDSLADREEGEGGDVLLHWKVLVPHNLWGETLRDCTRYEGCGIPVARGDGTPPTPGDDCMSEE